MSALNSLVQVYVQLSPYEGLHNEVSVMLNKKQARHLIRKLQRALKEDSHYCLPVLEFDHVRVINPNSSIHHTNLTDGVTGKIILDNW